MATIKSNAFSAKAMKRSIFTLFLLVCISCRVFAGRITGDVRSSQTGKPLAGAHVSIRKIDTTIITDSLGGFVSGELRPGSYTLFISKTGYEMLARTDVYVAGKGDKRVDIELAPAIRQLDKITIRGTSFRKAPDMASSTKLMNLDEILRAPGALADVQRAVQNLPSVASGGDNVNEVVVRGGVPGENLFIMDNIEIPNPNHFADQGSGGGVVSLINPLLVQGLTFNAGAPPAQYGGKASSVMDVTLRDGNKKMVLGGVDLGIGGAGFHAEGPLWKNATFMASGSKSFLDLISYFAPSTAVPSYWGAQTKLTQRLGNHKINLNGIFGDNNITIDNAGKEIGTRGEIIKAGGYVYAAGATMKSFWGENLSTVTTISGTGNSFERREYTPLSSGEIQYFRNTSTEQQQTLKTRIGLDVTANSHVLAGGNVQRADFDIDIRDKADTLLKYDTLSPGDSGTIVADPEIHTTPLPRRDHQTGYKYGAFLSGILTPLNRLKLVPGARVDGFDYNKSVTVDPRFSAVLSLTPELDLTAAFGIQHQQPDYVDLVISPENSALRPKQAITGIGGAEYVFTGLHIKCMLEGYYKQYNHLPVDSSLLEGNTEISRYNQGRALVSDGEGKSYGFELFAQKKLTKHLSGSAAYSYSQSWYKDLRPGKGDAWYPADFDFRNGLTLTGGLKFELLSKDWYKTLHEQLWFRLFSALMPIADRMEFSCKWRYLGGRPYTPHTYRKVNKIWVIKPDAKLNSERYPAYHSLDFRFERRFGFGFLHMIYYIDLQNVYNRENIWQYLYVDGNETRKKIYQLPFFPSGGLIIGF
ncbi:MAG: TonB-dependent receptor plug domain-containing protein [Chitinivibrionales bacterium]|nr:TonB-dependent receptor plug domain-containing protein [Chitinivibrionales bacterium]